jgi:small subunit ribosomal protein S2
MLKKKINSFLVNSLLNSQVHIGKKVKWDKTLNLYLFGLRHKTFFFNVKKTHLFIKRMVFFLYNSIINHKSCLFIGTNTLIHPIIDYLKVSLNQPGTNISWVGGTLTNWFKIKEYAAFLYSKNISSKIYSKFALKSADKINQKVHRYLKMKAKLKGLEFASRFPNIIICFEKKLNEFALHEAFILRLPLICFLNSDEYNSNIAYPIYGNTNSFESFNFYFNLILNSIKKGFIKRRLSFLNINKTILKKKSAINKSLVSNRAISSKLENFFNYSNQYQKFFLKLSIIRYYFFYQVWYTQFPIKSKINKMDHLDFLVGSLKRKKIRQDQHKAFTKRRQHNKNSKVRDNK